ncbi:2-dehydropantoate 2-reductase [Yonghaparkia alkaliphila]|uniref:2-dehydropantoate 2-reductase n=1 Tax=Microcella alkalica TaxID=355930 RepID=A0A839EDC5_9MICO|nr:2-dehydropantoate 2-reductase [Microcella alkalica]
MDSNAAHAAACRNPGALVELPDGSTMTTSLQVIASVDQVREPYDYALITLKAPAVPSVVTALRDSGLVENYVSLGNGLIQEVIAGVVGAGRLLVGTVSWGATFIAAGHVRQTTLAPFAVGEWRYGSNSDRLVRLIDLLSVVAPAHSTDNIVGQVWSKLLLNSSLSGLGTIAGADYATAVGTAGGRQLAVGMWTEGLRVAEAMGLSLDEVAGIRPERIDVDGPGGLSAASKELDALLEALGATKASMLQDLERGVPTEVDVINGAVVSAGADNDVPTPLNQRCAEIIRQCEKGTVRPGLGNLSFFDDLLSATVE